MKMFTLNLWVAGLRPWGGLCATLGSPSCRLQTRAAQKMNSSGENTHSKVITTHPFITWMVWPSSLTQVSSIKISANFPISVPEAGFRNENLCFPCSMVPSEYSSFLVLQPPLPTTPNWRPKFHVLWSEQFRHYAGLGGEMRTKVTQTEVWQGQYNGFHRVLVKVVMCILANLYKGEDPFSFKKY